MNLRRDIDITINGKALSINESISLAALLDELTIPTIGVAIAINQEIIHKSQWTMRIITGGEEIEIVSIVAGG